MQAVGDTTPAGPASAPVERSDRDDARSNGRGQRNDRQTKRRDQGSEARSAAEWVTLGMSSAIVLGLIALTSYFYLTASTDPVMVEVEPRTAEVYQAGDRYYLPITVRNRGGETGEEVRVRVTLTGAAGRQETSELQVQFLAGGGTSRAVMAFASDPRQGQIEAGVISYLEP
jgi:uncharacterized protein (TIGR02588 family)